MCFLLSIFFQDIWYTFISIVFFSIFFVFFRKKFQILALLSCAIGFLFLSLSSPYIIQPESAPFILVYCMDSSASLSEQERLDMIEYARNLSVKAKKQKIQEEWIVFGAEVQRKNSLPVSLAAQEKTSLQEALDLAMTIIRKRGQEGKIVLFSDASGISLEAQAFSRFKNVPVFFYHPSPRKDWQLLSFWTQGKHKAGMKIPFKIFYRSDFDGEIRLEIWANERMYEEKVFTVQKTQEGMYSWEGPPMDEEQVYFRAKAKGDPREENNCAYTFSQKFDSSPVLLITPQKQSFLERAY